MTFLDYAIAARDGWSTLQRIAGFWSPVLRLPSPVAPLAALGTLLALVVTTGVALTAFAVLISSALFLYLLLSQVLGLEFSLEF